MTTQSTSERVGVQPQQHWRKTTQYLAPSTHTALPAGDYDVYPGFPIGAGKISAGVSELARRIADQQRVIIEGYVGVLWDHFCAALTTALSDLSVRAAWTCVDEALKPAAQIEALVQPFLGGDDPIFGTRFTGELTDYFDSAKLAALRPDPTASLNILYGAGASLAGWDGLLLYLDVPKNEIQFRSRAGSINNLGTNTRVDAKKMYKRFYFVDWVVLNKHRAALLPSIDLMIDTQRPDDPLFLTGDDLRAALTRMSQNCVRARPWFEPGAWGGQWIKKHIPQLSPDVPNYAWSFELISPENGIMLESDDYLLEISFDFLMFHDHRAMLGKSADRFGYEFPIRFDFLDTFAGGNLSVQCHPRPDYIKRHFGETFTQDETYYILDCESDAVVYLGFTEDIDPQEFRAALERSFTDNVPVDIPRFVNIEPAHKHDLFLIPNGTIHCSGVNNLVLEISATPYIFTFKMYDWLRLDLDGKPRPLNIERAFENLYFSRAGEQAKKELLSQPQVIDHGEDWQIIDLPTHVEHFYGVQRFEFSGELRGDTNGSPHVLSLVEGQTVIVETGDLRQCFNYAETFFIPSAAQHYRLISPNGQPIKVICAYLK